MKKLSFITAATLVFLSLAFTQTKEIADHTQFFVVFLKRPANPPPMEKDAAEKLQAEHMANIRKMHAENKLVVAGPFLDKGDLLGIAIYTVSPADAAKLEEEDPLVKAKYLRIEPHLWFTGKGVLAPGMPFKRRSSQ